MAPTGQGHNLWATVETETFFIMVCLLMRSILIPYRISLKSCLVMVPVAGGAADNWSDLSIWKTIRFPDLGCLKAACGALWNKSTMSSWSSFPRSSGVPQPAQCQCRKDLKFSIGWEQLSKNKEHVISHEAIWQDVTLSPFWADTHFTKLPPADTSNGWISMRMLSSTMMKVQFVISTLVILDKRLHHKHDMGCRMISGHNTCTCLF